MRYLADYLQTAVFINKMWSIVPFGSGTQLSITCKSPSVARYDVIADYPSEDHAKSYWAVFHVFRTSDTINIHRYRYSGGALTSKDHTLVDLKLSLSDPQFIEKMTEWFRTINYLNDTNLPEMRDVKVNV